MYAHHDQTTSAWYWFCFSGWPYLLTGLVGLAYNWSPPCLVLHMYTSLSYEKSRKGLVNTIRTNRLFPWNAHDIINVTTNYVYSGTPLKGHPLMSSHPLYNGHSPWSPLHWNSTYKPPDLWPPLYDGQNLWSQWWPLIEGFHCIHCFISS